LSTSITDRDGIFEYHSRGRAGFNTDRIVEAVLVALGGVRVPSRI
jgi:hypothetical protein